MLAMNYDLHTHSCCSDGSLTPAALLALARDNGVDVLSITDHDTVRAYDGDAAASTPGLQVIPGIELSTKWAGRSVHIVGLNIDPENPALRQGIARQQQAREARARTIARNLEKLGMPDPFDEVAKIAGDAGIGRPHFATHLVQSGYVRDERNAYKKYLGAGKPGDVKDVWADFNTVVRWITSAGGVPVLAHPAKYRMTMAKLRLLLDDFVAAGGTAVEVVSGNQAPDVTKKLARLASDYALAASTGSDFHSPAQTWTRPGGCAELPANLPKVWDLW